MIYLLQAVNIGVSNTSSINWPQLVASIGSALVSIAVIIFNYYQTKKVISENSSNLEKTLQNNKESTERTLRQKRIEERKSEIYKVLNELYGPLYQLRKKSILLYDKFKRGKKENFGGGERFSTLLYLLKEGGPKNLSENDKVLLSEIIKVGRLSEKLIQDKAGLIDDKDLREKWFPLAAQHYLIIRLAYDGALKEEPGFFDDSTFPIQIDTILEKRIEALHAELEELK